MFRRSGRNLYCNAISRKRGPKLTACMEARRIRSIVAHIALVDFKGSAAAADPLVEQVPPGGGYDLPRGGYDPPGQNFGGSKLGSLGVFRTWDPQKKIPRKK